jgi:putative MATE family efflux protein
MSQPVGTEEGAEGASAGGASATEAGAAEATAAEAPAASASSASPGEAGAGGRGGGVWRTVRDAVRGAPQDFTQVGVGRAIFLLAVPMVLEMMMESLFGVVNAYWVSDLGQDALAAVGLTEAMLTIIFTVAMGLSMATTAMVARRIGEGDPVAASAAATQSILLGVAISVVVGAVGFAYGGELLRMMGAEPGVVEKGSGYPRIIFGTNVVIMLLFLNNAIFRGAGDAALAMRALWLGNLINLALDPLLIFGYGPFPELGVMGSAVATSIGRGTAVVYQFWSLGRGSSRVRVRLRQFVPDYTLIARLLRVSFGGMFQIFVATASWVVVARIVAESGKAAVAGYTVALRIIVVAILPAWGMSNAAATLVGQNLGAGRPDRAERSVWITGLWNMVFLLLVAVAFVVFSERLIWVFTDDPEVVPYGVDCLRYISYGYGFYAWGMVLAAAFNGAGDTWTPTWINVICFWALEIPLAYVLSAQAGLGARGVFLAITIAESLLAVVALLAFRAGRWKKQKV